MKKIVFLLLAAALMVVPATSFAESARSLVIKEWVGVSAVAATQLGLRFHNTFAFKVFVYGSADDTITVALTSVDSAPIKSVSSTAATSGEWLDFGVIPIVNTDNIAVSGIGSGTAYIRFSAVLF